MEIQKLKEAIVSKDVKVVSFDFFDTLLCRPCLYPYVLFRAAGKRGGFDGDFEAVRLEAERVAKSKLPAGNDDVTLEDLYREVSIMIGEEKIPRLKQAEMQSEYDYLYPRKPIEEAFHYALSLGKQVIIVSDMYLPACFLDSVLRKNGYTGYQKLYVSNEYMMTKHTKRLYGKVIEDLAKEGIAPAEILHIGDNAYVDIQNASECGLKAFYIECGTTALRNSEWFSKLEQPFSEADLFWLGLIANFFFDPFMKTKHSLPETLDSMIQLLLQLGDRTQLDLIAMLRRDRILPEKLQ